MPFEDWYTNLRFDTAIVSSSGGSSVTLNTDTTFSNCQMKMQILKALENLVLLPSFFKGNVSDLRVEFIPALIILNPFLKFINPYGSKLKMEVFSTALVLITRASLFMARKKVTKVCKYPLKNPHSFFI